MSTVTLWRAPSSGWRRNSRGGWTALIPQNNVLEYLCFEKKDTKEKTIRGTTCERI